MCTAGTASGILSCGVYFVWGRFVLGDKPYQSVPLKEKKTKKQKTIFIYPFTTIHFNLKVQKSHYYSKNS